VIRRWSWFGSTVTAATDDDKQDVQVVSSMMRFKNYLEYGESILRAMFFLMRIQHGHVMADGTLLNSALAGLSGDLSRWTDAANVSKTWLHCFSSSNGCRK
jgi:hypothetical protein